MNLKNNNCVICIYGINGSGKTSLSQMLIKYFPVCEIQSTDNLRKIFILNNPSHPYSNVTSYTAWQVLGEKNRRNIIEGFKNYRIMIADYTRCIISRAYDEKLSIILEGIHFDPVFTEKSKILVIPVLLTISNKRILKKRIIQKSAGRKKLKNKLISHIDEIFSIQKYLVNEARKHGYIILDTSEDPLDTTFNKLINKIGDRRSHSYYH